MKALWLSFASLALSAQVPFQSDSFERPRTLSLRHAIHLSTSHRHLPPLHKRYSPSELAHISSGSDHHGTSHPIKTSKSRRYRATNPNAFQAARRSSFYAPRAMMAGRALTLGEMEDVALAATLQWDEDEVDMPDITDVDTIASLGKMTANAYAEPGDGDWYNLNGTKWNVSESFGWLEDGIRGHVFADDTNSTIVVAIKGTSAGFIGGGGGTGHNDKTNDNLLFSCCCARVDWSWSTVCDCYTSPYTCKQDCLEEAVMGKSAYYPVATDLYNNITALYPHSQIWLTGHSLGGSLASLLSLTYGVPSVSFEGVADLLPARRLHLPTPPGLSHRDSNITVHVYHNADPIPQGSCTGFGSACTLAGFALESRCHSGRSIVYDTVGRLGWSVDIRTHRILSVVDKLLVKDWGVDKSLKKRSFGWWPGWGNKKPGDEDEKEKDDGQHGGRGVPDAKIEEDCIDCFKWSYEDDELR